MIDLKLDKTTHDLLLGDNGDLLFIDGDEELEQRIKSRLLVYYGEWFRDESQGVKWREEVFIKNPNFNTVESMIKATVIDDPRIEEFVDFSIDKDDINREGSIKMTLRTVEDTLINIEV